MERRRAARGAALALAAAVLACGGGGGTGGTDTVFGDPGDRDAADAAAADEAPADAARDPAGDPGIGDLPPDAGGDARPDAATDLPASDPGAPDGTAGDPGDDPGHADPGGGDAGPGDAPADTTSPADPGGEVAGPEPWVQCSDDAPCRALFGESATCNHDFPGGQCMGCDPEQPGVHVKCTQLSQAPEITLSCRFANGGACLYDCPCPSWLRCLESEGLCVLKACTADDQCGPFGCLEIGDPGSSRYCLPPR